MGQRNDAAFMSDGDIISLYFERDEAAISRTDEKYGRMLFRIAYNIIADTLDCEECKNDTYLGVWNTVPPTVPTVFSAFLSRIMRNKATDRYKAKKSEKRVPSELTVSIEELNEALLGDSVPDAECEARELGGMINSFVKSLSKRDRYIFIERFYLCETVGHIAEEMGIGKATVHRSLEKTKRGLREYLEESGVHV